MPAHTCGTGGLRATTSSCTARVGLSNGGIPCPTYAAGASSIGHDLRRFATGKPLPRSNGQSRGNGHARSGQANQTRGSAWDTVKETVQGFASNKIALLTVGAAGLIGLNLSFANTVERYYKDQIMKRVEAGFAPKSAISDAERLERKGIRQSLLDLFSQEDPSKFYYVIKGHAGAGKSTIVQEACRQVGGGVGYLEVSPVPEANFGREMGTAINFNFEEQVNLINTITRVVLGAPLKGGGEKLESLTRAAGALKEAAVEYRRKKGRPFVLVLDGVDRLKNNSPEVLLVLQEYAKEWAESEQITVVFVVSESSTLEVMRKQQSWSRAFQPIAIPDITPEESRAFLQRRGVSEEHADKLVKLAGGDFLQLEKGALLLRRGFPLEETVQILLRDAEPRFAAAGLLDATPQQEAGLKVIRALLDDKGANNGQPSIPAAEWRRLVEDPKQQDALMNGNVFDFDYEQLSFASRLVAAYAKELLPLRIAKKELLAV